MLTAEMIDRITTFDGGPLPVTSLYVGLGPERRDLGSQSTRASSLLHEIRPMTRDRSVNRDVRLSVRGDIERIETAMSRERARPGTVAVFACSGRDFYEEIELPRRVRDRITLDTTPWVRPMLAVLDEYHRTCVVVLDGETAHMWELYQGEIRELGDVIENDALLDQPPPRKPDYAGWHGLEEFNVHHKAEERAKRHFRRVAALLDDAYRAGRFELLAVGGRDYETTSFPAYLPHNLRPAVAGTFSIDSHTATTGDIRASAEAVVDGYERDEERRWVTEVFDKYFARGFATVGLDRCLWAGSSLAIQRLLVQDDATVPGVVCDESGWFARSGDACIICGKPPRRTEDVVDELAEMVIDTSGSVEHVLADTPLREHTLAAELRFPLPPKPDGTGF